jgi:hypothetical protein
VLVRDDDDVGHASTRHRSAFVRRARTCILSQVG